MHNAAFKELNIPAEYRLFEVKPEELEEFLLGNIPVTDTQGKSFSSQEILGFNITIPHKVRAKEILESKFPVTGLGKTLPYVKISGAINTVKRKADGALEYINTDVTGFSKSLREDLKFSPKDKNILLIGCGGAGRAVVAGLVWKAPHPAKIYIYECNNETVESTRKHFEQFTVLSREIEFISSEQIPEVIKKCELLVNASPVGMKESDGSVIDKNLLHKDLYVYDLVYNRETQLIKDAKSQGVKNAVNGLGMLLYQGVDAFELWTCQKAPVEIMRKALIEALSK
ncbi:MAG: shikimate dehydrogenase [Candidatus Omnitrophica bacterium]|nr:shikimate dehydrogenase [Candidatus Omnitrophota bacterium]